MKHDLTDENIHKGHRQRMRSKLEAHGKTIFDTYELLEMLLYYTVPYRDTNPIAKRLIATFKDLDGVLSASVEQLSECEGVGAKTARFLTEVGELSSILGAELVPNDRSIFVGYNDAGGFFVDYFKNVEERKVVAAFLDNKLELISLEEIAVGSDYDSAAIKAKPFIDGAIKHKASAVITAHNHPFGSPYPTQGDRATNIMVRNALDLIKVTLAEHFVVSGDRYVGIMQELSVNYSQSPYLDDFIKARGDGERSYSIS